MTSSERVPLSPRTSFGVGGPARFFVEACTPADVLEAYAFAREKDVPLRVIGEGTNILVPDQGIDALVVHYSASEHTCSPRQGGVLLEAEAGASWDDLVSAAAREGLWGIENLAGIPGSSGGALVQNIGAYGVEFSRMFAWADVIDLAKGEVVRITKEEAALAYRTSLFKGRRNLIIVRIALMLGEAGEPNLTYADLARLAESSTPLATPADIGAAVRGVRARKFPPKGCAGSFFKNPIVSEEVYASLAARYPGLPRYPGEGGVKIPLAFLLDQALHLKGYRRGPAWLFESQPLVLVAEAGARASDIEALAGEIEARVQKEFAVTLEREVETFA